MYIRLLVGQALRLVLPIALLSTLYLYLYPVAKGCAFPSTDGSITRAFRDTIVQHISSEINGGIDSTARGASLAPFRLLVLADPQLEGDSSLPKREDSFVPRLRAHWADLVDAPVTRKHRVLQDATGTLLRRDVPQALLELRKRIDLWGNDYYLGHIYRTLKWWARPTHVTVLGDLIGSQWVSDDEFEWRGWRYWNRMVPDGIRVEDNITTLVDESNEHVFEINDVTWKNRIINIAGNHDIGYAGDITEKRMERFERVFGNANWDVRFEYPSTGTNGDNDEMERPPSIHMIVLNSLMLDTPALSPGLQSSTYSYLNSVMSKRGRSVNDKSSFVLTLTHLPLFKKSGVCVDPPFFDFWPDNDGGGMYLPRGLKEQNHLSRPVSEPGYLEYMYGMKGDVAGAGQGKGRDGLILNGHDHEGCDTWHYIPVNSTWNSSGEYDGDGKTAWAVSRWADAGAEAAYTGVREVTLRSMMGDYGGNAGLLSAWYDFAAGRWQYDIQMCSLGTQHVWWFAHSMLVAVVVMALVEVGLASLQGAASNPRPPRAPKKT
jgi:hypothetical protein